MRKFYLLVFTLILVFFLNAQLPAQGEPTFTIRMNGHSYPQQDDLIKRSLQEWFSRAFDTGGLGTLIDSLAQELDVTVTQLSIPDSVQISYLIPDGESDFVIQVSQADWLIVAEGFGCPFNITIADFEVQIGGTGQFSNGQFLVQLDQPVITDPVVSVATNSDFLCGIAAALIQGEITTQINGLVAGLSDSLDVFPVDEVFAFLNPFGFLEVGDSTLVEEAVRSFPMDMNLVSEEVSPGGTVQLVLEIDFLLGTTTDSSAFIGLDPGPVNGTYLDAGGFSFLYWVLQRGYSWFSGWDESQRVNAAFSVMETAGITGYRIEPRWNEIQIRAYTGTGLNPDNVTPEIIDSFIADAAYWDTTAFNRTEDYLLSAQQKGLIPLMALGVGHQDRTPETEGGQAIAPATESWQVVEGYVPVSADEYLYNLKIFAHATVRKFAPYVTTWQLENELNAAGFAAALPEWWRKGDLWRDENFRNRVWDILVDAVRTEDPQALITHDLHMLGFMQGLENWVDDMDIVGVNFYPNQVTAVPNLGFSVGEYVWAVRRALSGIQQANKPVWVIETGFPGIYQEESQEPLPVNEDILYFSENRQAQYMESAVNSAVEQGARGFFYYSLTTQEDTLGGRIDNRSMRYSGLIRRDTEEQKPAFAVFEDLFNSYYIPTAIPPVSGALPQDIILYGNFPNPFNPVTEIRFFLPEAQNISLRIYDLLGREIAVIADGKFISGTHDVAWDAGNYASGLYYYRLQGSSGFTETRKLVLLK